MAIASSTITINAGWTRGQLITQLEQGLTFAGFHSPVSEGLICGVGYTSATSIGGTVGTTNDDYLDVFPITNTGIGTGASFNILRTNGVVDFIQINRPGIGYSNGDIVTIPADSIGGTVNGATNIIIPVVVESTATGINTYNFSYTGQYVLSGTDINGSVSNVGMSSSYTITVREGDTLNITCTNSSNNYAVWVMYQDNKYSGQALAVNTVVNDYKTSGTITWKTRPGQAGTYYISSNSSSQYDIKHQISILPNDGSRTFSPVGYGSTTAFYDKSLANPYPWGVFKHTIQSGKRFGTTFRGIQVLSDSRIGFLVGSSFQPTSTSPNILGQKFKGSRYLDLGNNLDTSTAVTLDSAGLNGANTSGGAFALASRSDHIETIIDPNAGNAYSLELKCYKSGIDPNFVVFSYRQPNLSSTSLSGNNKCVFFFHNFTTNIWDLDNVFLSGMTFIFMTGGNTTAPTMAFRTYCAGGCDQGNSIGPSMRAAEFGYTNSNYTSSYGGTTAITDHGSKVIGYTSNAYPNSTSSVGVSGIYYRTNDATEPLVKNRGIGMPDSTNFNAIIGGIPLNSLLVPVPYYLPDDFVIIQFENSTPSLNVQQGDTIVVQAGVEEYVIITGSYNQTTKTRGILFCARTI